MRFLAFLVWIGLATPAAAQPSCGDEAGARQSFLEARALAEQRQLSAAREAYERSLEACGRVPTAYNLAVVQLQLGAPVEAKGTAEAVLGGSFGPLEQAAREAVDALLERARAAIGTLVIDVGEAPEGATLSLDGGEPQPVPSGEALTVAANPGEHRLVLRAPDGRSAQTVERATAGERRTVALTLPPAMEAPQPIDEVVPTRRRRRVWIGVAVALVAVAAATTATVLLTRPEDPVEDLVWGRAELPLVTF